MTNELDLPPDNRRVLPEGMEQEVYDQRVEEAGAILRLFSGLTMTPKLSAQIMSLLAPLEARWEEENASFKGNQPKSPIIS